jgi:hypothetical protein
MSRSPRPPKQPLLPWPLIRRAGLVSFILVGDGLGVLLKGNWIFRALGSGGCGWKRNRTPIL